MGGYFVNCKMFNNHSWPPHTRFQQHLSNCNNQPICVCYRMSLGRKIVPSWEPLFYLYYLFIFLIFFFSFFVLVSVKTFLKMLVALKEWEIKKPIVSFKHVMGLIEPSALWEWPWLTIDRSFPGSIQFFQR